MSQAIDGYEAAFRMVREMLEPHGWRVEKIVSDRDFEIEVSHELSQPFRTVVPRDYQGEPGSFVERSLLDRPEIEIVARRPQLIEHARLLQALRGQGMAGKWPRHVFVGLSAALFENFLLTEAEARWLSDAGPVAWT